MRADDLELSELVEMRDGNISLHGRRLVLHSIHAFAQFRQDIMGMLGQENARRIITRFGYFWGQADAAAMKRVFSWDSTEELIRAGFRLQSLEGQAEARVERLELDEAAGSLVMNCLWKDPVEAEEQNVDITELMRPASWKLIGYASGYVSFCLGKSVFFVEEDCRVDGGVVCCAVGKDIDSWGDEIAPHLGFFEADDIRGKVQELSRQLREKTRELDRQREKLAALRGPHRPYFSEGRSRAIRGVLDLAARVAKFDSSVLITGETGVGKEILARYIHDVSPRGKHEFVAINCGALPETLLESELFGYKAGSFTGAARDRIGLFEQAAEGTVFLDEVGDTSLAMQVKVLRVLQEKEIMRIGENHGRPVNVRIIAAANKDLDDSVADGTFREDLLYRLRVIEIEMPPLRERVEDILPLARFLVEKLCEKLGLAELKLDATCLDYLQTYSWPGNVRELENALERAAVLTPDGVIRPDYLPPHIVGHEAGRADAGADLLSKTLEQVEMEHIQRVLRSQDGNRSRTARVLGISSATLWRKLKKPD